MSILKHERGHQLGSSDPGDGEHAQVYLDQILDKSSTTGTSEAFQWGIIASFTQYVMNDINAKSGEINQMESLNLIDKFNKSNKGVLYQH